MAAETEGNQVPEADVSPEQELATFFSSNTGDTVVVEDIPPATETVSTPTGAEEAQPEAKDTPPVEEPEELPEEPKGNEDWKRLRLRLKEQEKALAELRKPAVPEEQAPTETPVPEIPIPEIPAETPRYSTVPKPPKSEPAISPHVPFVALARLRDGDTAMAGYEAEAQQHILGEMTPAEVVGVLRSAKAGGFGALSDTIADLANEYLPVLNATWQDRTKRQEAERAAVGRREEAWQRVLTTHAGLRERTSTEYQEFVRANAELVSKAPSLWSDPDAPSLVAEYMALKRAQASQAVLTSENTKLKEEVAGLRKQLGVTSSAPAGGQPQGSKARPLTPEEELAQAFAAMGAGR